MDSTSQSLLIRAGNGDEAAWQQLADLYQPMIRNWLERQALAAQDADDLTQDVMTAVVEALPEFEHNGRTGAFRNWLRTVTVNRIRTVWRRRSHRKDPVGGSDFHKMLEALEDPNSDVSELWNRQHDDYVLRQALKQLDDLFEQKTLTAFQRVALSEEPVPQVAEDLEMTVAAVYGAKARVLQKLRKELEGVIDF